MLVVGVDIEVGWGGLECLDGSVGCIVRKLERVEWQ